MRANRNAGPATGIIRVMAFNASRQPTSAMLMAEGCIEDAMRISYPVNLILMNGPGRATGLVDRLAHHRGEFMHQAIGHLPGYGDLALALEFRDRGLGVGADGAG